MSMGRAEAGILVMLLLVSPSTAQAPVDFTGKWTLVPAERAGGTAMGSAPPALSAHGDMGSGWGSEITITQDAAALTVVYTYFHAREIQPPITLTYMLNGGTSTNTINLGRGSQQQISKVAWRDASLAITTTHRFVNPQNGQPMTSETIQVLSLESATRLAIETTREGVLGGKTSTTRTLYRKN